MLSDKERTIWASCKIQDHLLNSYASKYVDPLYEDYDYRLTGKLVRNVRSNKIGIILRETHTGSIQVLESIEPKVICTHDNWNTLEILEEVE